jgi:hypothetical protein
LFSKEKLCYINNGILYYGGEAVSGLSFPDINTERTFVSMGAKLIIFPDKVYINTADLSDYGSLEAIFTGDRAECTLCRGDGDLYENYVVGSAPPDKPSHGDLWVDTAVSDGNLPHKLARETGETATPDQI